MKRKWVGLMAGVAFLGWAVSSVAGPGWGRGMGPAGGSGPHPYMASYLGLTQEQEAQLQAMREKHFKEISPLQQELFNKRQELRLLWANPNPDADQIMAKQREISQLQAQMQEMSTKHLLEARSILTPEQQQKLGTGRGPGFGSGWGRGPMRGCW